jgi:hypothetical protein
VRCGYFLTKIRGRQAAPAALLPENPPAMLFAHFVGNAPHELGAGRSADES